MMPRMCHVLNLIFVPCIHEIFGRCVLKPPCFFPSWVNGAFKIHSIFALILANRFRSFQLCVTLCANNGFPVFVGISRSIFKTFVLPRFFFDRVGWNINSDVHTILYGLGNWRGRTRMRMTTMMMRMKMLACWHKISRIWTQMCMLAIPIGATIAVHTPQLRLQMWKVQQTLRVRTRRPKPSILYMFIKERSNFDTEFCFWWGSFVWPWPRKMNFAAMKGESVSRTHRCLSWCALSPA